MSKQETKEEWASKASRIEEAYEQVKNKKSLTDAIHRDVEQVILGLDRGDLRVCQKTRSGDWEVLTWVKKAILLFFRIKQSKVIRAGELNFYDKIPLKTWTGKEEVRVAPHALVRYGAFVDKNTVLMPSYVNIGARVGEGTLVDTWATVGSCAQVGRNVHLSGGVGLGGVLEPIQAKPVVIEDHAFIGSRAIIVEGAIIRRGAVIGAGTIITSSTRIIDVTQKRETVYRGEVPENSVVIAGTSLKQFPAGVYNIPSALIIGKRSSKTDRKTSLNDCLREYNIS